MWQSKTFLPSSLLPLHTHRDMPNITWRSWLWGRDEAGYNHGVFLKKLFMNMLHNVLTFNEQNTKARWNIFEPNVFKRQPAHPADSIRNNSNSLNEYTLRKKKNPVRLQRDFHKFILSGPSLELFFLIMIHCVISSSFKI